MKNIEKMNFATKTIHSGESPDPSTGAMFPPLFQTATYLLDYVGEGEDLFFKESHGYSYTRTANPTTKVLENKLAVITDYEECVVTSSGLGAISAVLSTILRPGDHVVVGDVIYGSTVTLFNDHFREYGIEVTYVDTSCVEDVISAMKENTKLIYIESPSNPNLKITDIKACAKIAHENEALLIMDSTFAPPPAQFASKLGVDICIFSTTKYINGHGNAVGGAILGEKKQIDKIRTHGMKIVCGNPASPFNSWLTIMGLKTLDIRIRKHSEIAMQIARYLEKSPYIEKVFYPGLESHKNHEVAKAQMEGLYGGMIAFELKDGINGKDKIYFAKQFLINLKLITIAASLGEMDSLIEHPASMTHRGVAPEERLKAGITDGLVRMSVGLEDVNDLISDIDNALVAASK